jgi:hypothetical protein
LGCKGRPAWAKTKLTGAELLGLLPSGIEIVIPHGDGGDYINREQLEWYRRAGAH